MKRIEKQFNKAAKHIGLHADDKARIRSGLSKLMEGRPVETPSRSSFGSFAGLFQKKFAYGMLTVLLVIGVATGTGVAAESSLPGDALYGIKVHVSEELRSAFILSEVKQAQWEAERLQRRIGEIQELVEQNALLDEGIMSSIDTNIRRHGHAVTEATQSFDTLEDVGAISSIIDDLQSALDTYGNILSTLAQQHGQEIEPRVQDLLTQIEETEQAAIDAQLDIYSSEVRDSSETFDAGQGGHFMAFTSPQAGDVMTMGTLHPIGWEIDIENARVMTLILLSEDARQVGYITVHDFSRHGTPFRWNPRFVRNQIGGDHKVLKSGSYRLRMVVETHDGRAFGKDSDVFRIVDPVEKNNPEATMGHLSVRVIDTDGNLVENPYVEIRTAEGRRVDARSGYRGSWVGFELAPALYTVVASGSNVTEPASMSAWVLKGETAQRIVTVNTLSTPEKEKLGMVDLTVSDVSTDARPLQNTQFTLSYDMMNIGESGMAGKRSHGFRIEPALASSDYTIGSVQDSCGYTAYLESGVICRVDRDLLIRKPGNYVVTVTIDSSGYIDELDEGNNSASYEISIGANEPVISFNTLTKKEVRQGEWLPFSMTWNNVPAHLRGDLYISDQDQLTVHQLKENWDFKSGPTSIQIPADLPQGEYELTLFITGWATPIVARSVRFEVTSGTSHQSVTIAPQTFPSQYVEPGAKGTPLVAFTVTAEEKLTLNNLTVRCTMPSGKKTLKRFELQQNGFDGFYPIDGAFVTIENGMQVVRFQNLNFTFESGQSHFGLAADVETAPFETIPDETVTCTIASPADMSLEYASDGENVMPPLRIFKSGIVGTLHISVPQT